MPKPNRARHSRRGAKNLDHMRVPRAWHLLQGHIELFNSETLIDILARFGVAIVVVVTKEVRVRYFAPDQTSGV